MITENSVIFIIEDNKLYGAVVQSYLGKIGFKNVVLFHDEKHCLNSMCQRPEVMISDYQLNYMNGLKLLEEAKKRSSGFYSILLSGTFDKVRYSNDMPLLCINKYIRKDGNEFKKLSEILGNIMNPAYNLQFY